MALQADSLQQELSSLPSSLRELLARHDFDAARWLSLARRLAAEHSGAQAPRCNRVREVVQPPRCDELSQLPPAGSAEHRELVQRGRALLEAGEVAFCVMAGGMATRMQSVVKALVPIWPTMTFLDFRLAEARSWAQRYGQAVPLWLMTSHATEQPLTQALSQAQKAGQLPPEIATFRQGLSLRLRPDGGLFRDRAGEPSVYATGHGDLVDALRRAGLCAEFISRGGKYVWIANLDNLGATIDEALLGWVAARDADLMVEVCDKEPGDRGGIPVHCAGKLQVLEEFRLPHDFDASQVRSFNTNTFVVRADKLQNANFSWTYFDVQKKVDGEVVMQSERLLQEMTAHLATAYVRVPRTGAESRFLPVKDFQELELRRPLLQKLAERRGLLGAEPRQSAELSAAQAG